MKYVLTIDRMNNAAFSEDEGGDLGASGAEVARILREASYKVDNEPLTPGNAGVLLDFNGNRVGKWEVTG